MIEYQKLATFTYKKNNKKYQILVDNNNKYFFMEINPDTLELSYVKLEEYIDFIQIFCINSPVVMIKKDKKNGKKLKIIPKILIAGGAVILSLSSASIITTAVVEARYNARIAAYYETHDIQEEVQRHVSFVVEDKEEDLIVDDKYYNDLTNTLFIYDNKYIGEYLGTQDVEKEDMIRLINENDKISSRFKPLFREYIDKLYETYPNADKRILYDNLKDLEVVECDKGELTRKTLSIDSCACYVPRENKIYTLTDYEYQKGTWEYQIIFHEISHALRMSNIYRDDGETIKIQATGSSLNNVIIDEALNSLFAVSLFDYEENDIAYQLQSNYLKIMLECMDNYSLDDYVNHSLSYFADKLDEHNGDNNYATTILNLIDVQYQDYHSDKIDIEQVEYYPIYDYISDMYYSKYIDNSMSYDAARRVADTLVSNVMFDVPEEYNIDTNRFYENLDEYCKEIGIDIVNTKGLK